MQLQSNRSPNSRPLATLPRPLPFIRERAVPRPLLAASLISCLTICQPFHGSAEQTNSSLAEGFEKHLDQIKHPVTWLSWGADFRYRNEFINNGVCLTHSDPLHEQDVQRFRGRLWAAGNLMTNLTLNARLVAEPREWMEPSFVGAYRAQSGFESRFGMADNLNVRWTDIMGQPLSITAGRQDVMPGEIGDGWLIGDGTPLDGSMTYYFDAIRLKYAVEPIQTTFNFMYIYQNPLADEWVPTLGDGPSYPLSEQREQGLVLHAVNKSIRHTQLEGYFIYKHDDRETFNIAGVPKTPGDNADIFTIGGSISGAPSVHWQYAVEGAYQFGQKEDKILGTFATRDLDAYGGKARLSYLFKDRLNNQLSLVGEYLSGDDPNSDGKDEMFDILWGRWPRWSDMYLYSYGSEVGGRIGQMSNLGRVGPNWSFSPVKSLTISATYNALVAPESAATRSIAPLFSNDGNFRGHYTQAMVKYQFNKHFSGHLLGEWIWQGDYYKQRDLMTFLRAEVTLTF